jgi:hypothetical protein
MNHVFIIELSLIPMDDCRMATPPGGHVRHSIGRMPLQKKEA